MIGSILFFAKGRSDGATLSDVISNSLGSLATTKVASIDKKAFQALTDQELVSRTVKALEIEPLQLDRASSSSSVTPKDVKTTNHFGETVYVDGVEVVTKVPFTGVPELFELRPNQYNLSPPQGRVSGKNLVVGITLPAAEKASAVEIIKDTLDSVQLYIDNQRSQIDTFNAQLENVVTQLIAARRVELESQDELLSKLSGI